MESLLHRYNRTEVLYDLDTFLTDFTLQESAVPLNEKKYESIDKAYCLGETPLFSVFEVHHHHVADARVALTKQAVEIMKSRQKFTECALFFFVPKNSDSFRISLVTVDWADNKKASNPRRFSFLVGENQKIHTASQQLSSSVRSREDLLKRFSIEVVNDEFYKKISEHFEDLLKTIKYPSVCEQSKQEEAKRNFAVRLIGRLIFCWFLKKKIRQDGSALIPEELLSSERVNKYENYYHEILEPLFFETLNKQPQDRIQKCRAELFARIPFLNGGLFEAHNPEDGYKYDEKTETCYLGMAITIPNDWFIKFFETLETYNFTIDENTSTDIDLAVDPEMLGRIFENLLASINPETNESVRKATGSYYTPREIVDYMVTQSLKQYLYTKTDIDHKVIDSLFEFEPQIATLSDFEKQRIYQALSTAKVLDPAVGSGAFPMGVLQKIMSIIHIIDPKGSIYRDLSDNILTSNLSSKQLDYINKYTLIRDCIYGVDIQPMAIEICRLRFFLTLIVEEESDNPKPLPNLNFNFACANTLIPLDNNNILELKQKIQSKSAEIEQKKLHPLLNERNIWEFSKEQQEQLKTIAKEITKLEKEKDAIKKELGREDLNSFLNGEDYIAQLRAYRKQFFASSGKRKEILKNKFIETQRRMLDALQANDWGNEKVIKLQSWKPFENTSTDWFDPSWMFDVEDGFDIVIANPPYFVYQAHHVNEIQTLRKNPIYGIAFGGKLNAYKLFLANALKKLTKNNGINCFIFQNSFMGDKQAANLRKYVLENTQLVSIDSFPERDSEQKRVFKSVKMSVCIVLIRNTKSNKEFNVNIWNDKYKSSGLATSFSPSDIEQLDGVTYVIPRLKREYKDIVIKMVKHHNIRLKCYEGELNVTFHKKFFTTNTTYPAILKGASIQRYYYTFQMSQGAIEYLDEPGYLASFGTSKKAKHHHYERIAMQGMTGANDKVRIIMTIIPQGYYLGNSCNYILVPETIHINALLGILNSSIINWFFRCFSTNSNVNGYEVENFPIPNLSNKQEKEIGLYVKMILDEKNKNHYADTSNLEAKIDSMVYKLYGLTDEEIKIVEESQLKKIKN